MFTRIIVTINTIVIVISLTIVYIKFNQTDKEQENIAIEQSKILKNLSILIDSQERILKITDESEMIYYNVILLQSKILDIDDNIEKAKSEYTKCLKKTKQTEETVLQ